MAKAGDINNLHRKIEKAVQSELGIGSSLKCVDLEKWDKVVVGSVFGFDLFPKLAIHTDTAMRNHGGRVTVLRLHQANQCDEVETNPIFTLCWHEEWKKTGENEFTFLAASLTLFVGASYGEKTQLLRADWDNLDHVDCSPGKTPDMGQPHWHIDAPLGVILNNAFSGPMTEDDYGGVSEPDGYSLAPESLSGVDGSSIHFPMGGWTHGQDQLLSWQVPFSGEPEILIQWFRKVIVYLKCHFDYNRSPLRDLKRESPHSRGQYQ